MLGLLRRLHRLHIQFCLEGKSEETGIIYPRSQVHNIKDGQISKDGRHMPNMLCVSSVTDKEIGDAMKRGREKAQQMLQELGMADLLQNSKCWENPPQPGLASGKHQSREDESCHDIESDDDSDDGEDGEVDCPSDDVLNFILQEANLMENAEDVSPGISQLSNAGIIRKDLRDTSTPCTNHHSKKCWVLQCQCI